MISFRTLSKIVGRNFCHKVAQPLKNVKPKSERSMPQSFVDLRHIQVTGGNGGNGCISFLHLCKNEYAGPDGGDGGNGAHVIFQASHDVKDLSHLSTIIRGSNGEKGQNKDCNGKNADHLIIKVPVGTIIRDASGKIIGDLEAERFMFVAARGGAGGRGNHFFVTDTQQAPEICEYGAIGEHIRYTLEIKTMAHFGLIGFPNAGKSTLLRAISRARPKVAPYPFTTLKPHLGMVLYDDYEQIAVADLPGLIPDSHKNKGLGIQFLKHAERCLALIYILDVSATEPLTHLNTLQYELSQFSPHLAEKPQLIVANKIDLINDDNILDEIKSNTNIDVVPVSAKLGTNILDLLYKLRQLYDKNKDFIT